VNPEVAKALKANNGKLITEMEELTGKTVLVKSDPMLHQEHFDIQ
jgi:ribonuclease G